MSGSSKIAAPSEMNGAESLVRTLVAGGADVCFSNPGTSEMHFVAALDRVEGMSCVLALFEGVATGAADGWARMTERPGLTLLHLGPGLANGLANLHNARKARSPIVNVVGEHTTQHLAYDAPLSSDTEGVARPMSHWVRTGMSSTTIAADGAEALQAARTGAGRIASLILPADTAWGPSKGPAKPLPVPARTKVSDRRIAMAANALKGRGKVLFFLGAEAVRARVLDTIGAIAAKAGADMLGQTSLARTERGVGRTPLKRLAYPVDAALEMLKPYDTLILIGASQPIAFFNYPNKPSTLARPDARILPLVGPEDDIADAVARLAERVGAKPADRPVTPLSLPPMPQDGRLTGELACAVIANLMPDDSIICDESVSNGRYTVPATHGARPHDWLQITGGSIGIGPPLALGAAVAGKGRQVINTEADGSAMYTLQGLWSQARARAKVITVIWANRRYEILTGELFNVGANPGRKAMDMITLNDPILDWVKLAEGQGVPARKAETVSEFITAFQAGLKENGPFLIEAVI